MDAKTDLIDISCFLDSNPRVFKLLESTPQFETAFVKFKDLATTVYGNDAHFDLSQVQLSSVTFKVPIPSSGIEKIDTVTLSGSFVIEDSPGLTINAPVKEGNLPSNYVGYIEKLVKACEGMVRLALNGDAKSSGFEVKVKGLFELDPISGNLKPNKEIQPKVKSTSSKSKTQKVTQTVSDKN